MSAVAYIEQIYGYHAPQPCLEQSHFVEQIDPNLIKDIPGIVLLTLLLLHLGFLFLALLHRNLRFLNLFAHTA